MNPPVFELVVATVHWTVAFKVFKSWPGQQKRHTPKGVCLFLEVPARFELANESFADSCLTTWPRYHIREC